MQTIAVFEIRTQKSIGDGGGQSAMPTLFTSIPTVMVNHCSGCQVLTLDRLLREAGAARQGENSLVAETMLGARGREQ
jgi:hypothetical protein